MTPLISVIVPCYNAEAHLSATMGNLIYQSLFGIYGEDCMEILLIDDCSTDNTGALLDDLHRQFPARTRVLHLPENRGAGGARNVGMDEAKGTYVGFVDCDDLVDVTYFERLYATAVADGQALDYVDAAFYDEARQTAILVTPPELAGALDGESKSILLCNIGYMYTKLIKRELLNAYGIRCREHTSSEDEDFLAEVVTRAESVGVFTEPLYLYKETADSTSKSAAADPMKPFSMLISCVLSAYSRMSANPAYDTFRYGAEAFYCNRFGLALQLFDAYKEAGIMTSDFTRELKETMRSAYRLTVTLPLAENPYLSRSLTDPGDLARIRKYLAV